MFVFELATDGPVDCNFRFGVGGGLDIDELATSGPVERNFRFGIGGTLDVEVEGLLGIGGPSYDWNRTDSGTS